MNIYQVTGPKGSSWHRLVLRVMAYSPRRNEDGRLKVVVQCRDGLQVIAEDPIGQGWMEPLEFLQWMAHSVQDGWEFEPGPTNGRIRAKQDYDAYQRR